MNTVLRMHLLLLLLLYINTNVASMQRQFVLQNTFVVNTYHNRILDLFNQSGNFIMLALRVRLL